MGQCSSTTKQQRSKQGEEKQIDVPAVDDEENDGDIVVPTPSYGRQQRRAIDDRTAAPGQPMATDAASSAPPAQSDPRQHESYDLAALRASVDDNTCTALLALRMGRGSSVSGLATSAAHSLEGRATSAVMAPLPEYDSVKEENGTVDTAPGAGKESKRRPEGEQQQEAGLQLAYIDSNERLEKLLSTERRTEAAPTLTTRV